MKTKKKTNTPKVVDSWWSRKIKQVLIFLKYPSMIIGGFVWILGAVTVFEGIQPSLTILPSYTTVTENPFETSFVLKNESLFKASNIRWYCYIDSVRLFLQNARTTEVVTIDLYVDNSHKNYIKTLNPQNPDVLRINYVWSWLNDLMKAPIFKVSYADIVLVFEFDYFFIKKREYYRFRTMQDYQKIVHWVPSNIDENLESKLDKNQAINSKK